MIRKPSTVCSCKSVAVSTSRQSHCKKNVVYQLKKARNSNRLLVKIDYLVPLVMSDQIQESLMVFRSDLDGVFLFPIARPLVHGFRKPGRYERHFECIGIRVKSIEGLWINRSHQCIDSSFKLKGIRFFDKSRRT